MTIATQQDQRESRSASRPLKGFAALVALVLTLATPGLVFAWTDNSFSSADEALLVQLTNQARASAGLSALKVDATLTSVARWRSKDMVDRDYFSHTIPPNGTKVFDELKRIGYCYVAAGENIGTNNFPDDVATQTIQDGFMGSAGHRANILGNWVAIGVGAYKGTNAKHMWTVLFAIKCSSAPAPTPKPTPRPAPKSTARPIVIAPTPSPTPEPTVAPVSPTLAPGDLDPAEALGVLGSRPRSLPGGGPQPPLATGPPPPPESPLGDAAASPFGLQVVDVPLAGNLIDTIVGDVAGSYFGH